MGTNSPWMGRRGNVLSIKGCAKAWACFGFVVRDQSGKYREVCPFGDTWGNTEFLYLLRNLLSLQQCPVTQLWRLLFLVVYFLHKADFLSFTFSVLIRLICICSEWCHYLAIVLAWYGRIPFFPWDWISQAFCVSIICFAVQKQWKHVASHLKLKQQS